MITMPHARAGCDLGERMFVHDKGMASSLPEQRGGTDCAPEACMGLARRLLAHVSCSLDLPPSPHALFRGAKNPAKRGEGSLLRAGHATWATGHRRQTVKTAGFACAVLCILLVFGPMRCLQPIATQVLFPRLHPHDPERPVVTFAALGDMGEGGSEQIHVAHAMYSVCQRDGCDFVLGLG